MEFEFETLNLKRKNTFKEWQNFLIDKGIHNFNEIEINKIDQTLGAFDEHRNLIATGSVAINILKYVAVEKEYKGKLFNQLLTKLLTFMTQEGIFHWFVFTKPQYIQSFKNVGFSLLASSQWGAILERGNKTVHDYTKNLIQNSKQYSQRVAAIVMNANPFTNGHKFLVQKASLENDLVYVFVVDNDSSLFKTKERIQLVKEGTKQIKNVVVVNGENYMVSPTTFPAYFIQSPHDIIRYQTTLDARIFRNKIAPPLNIKKRYLGTEPYSNTTNVYNKTLQEELPPNVETIIVERKKSKKLQVISASLVRRKIQAGDLEEIQEVVPKETFDFIAVNLKDLQSRLKKV